MAKRRSLAKFGDGVRHPLRTGGRVTGKTIDTIMERPGQSILLLVRVGAGCWILFVLWFFWSASRPAIKYERVNGSETAYRVCPGQEFEFEVEARVHRAPAVVAITENWVSKDLPEYTILGDGPRWRIVPTPTIGRFVVRTRAPLTIPPGNYEYYRALGLNDPFILKTDVTILPKSECQ
jgi:hypothetical protein